MKPKFYKTESKHVCPTLRVEGNTGIADPCYIIPDNRWSSFLFALYDAGGNVDKRTVFVFGGVPFRVKRTDGDGVFQGVAVDTAMLAEFPLEAALKAFGFEMKPWD